MTGRTLWRKWTRRHRVPRLGFAYDRPAAARQPEHIRRRAELRARSPGWKCGSSGEAGGVVAPGHTRTASRRASRVACDNRAELVSQGSIGSPCARTVHCPSLQSSAHGSLSWRCLTCYVLVSAHAARWRRESGSVVTERLSIGSWNKLKMDAGGTRWQWTLLFQRSGQC
jgi:hypothetical protein